MSEFIFDNQLSVLALMIGIILIVPPVCRKIHVPSIVGFILAGIAIGPFGFGWFSGTQTIQTLGKLGMLYIMLQAGIEIDRNNFSQHKRQAAEFGVLSFLLPFLLGMITSRCAAVQLEYGFPAWCDVR